MVNLTCRLDILKDFVKKNANKLLLSKINALTAENNSLSNNSSTYDFKTLKNNFLKVISVLNAFLT